MWFVCLCGHRLKSSSMGISWIRSEEWEWGKRGKECEEATIIDIWRTVGMGAYKHGESEKRPQNQNHKSRETKFAKRNDRNKTTCGKQDKTLTAALSSEVGSAATARLANGLWQKQQKCWNERVETEMQIKRSKNWKQMSRTYSGRYKMLLYKTEREKKRWRKRWRRGRRSSRAAVARQTSWQRSIQTHTHT